MPLVMADTTPDEVLIEFLRALTVTIQEFEEPLVPVLRGSLLLRHWFGESARPAADIDLECFLGQINDNAPPDEAAGARFDRYGRYGRYGEFDSLVDYGRAMCRYAADYTHYYQTSSAEDAPVVAFLPIDGPAEGESLWTYGTPGERYYAGWTWRERQEPTGWLQMFRGETRRAQTPIGRLQIDIAEPGAYTLEDICTADVNFIASQGQTFRYPAYMPEMLLAAKLSWLLRSLTRRANSQGPLPPAWTGEPKDLFDVHLLLTQAELDAAAFQKSMVAVGASDDLDWDNLEAIFDVRRTAVSDADFSNWDAFRKHHPELATRGPVELLRTVADRLEPLLGDFRRPDEAPFLHALRVDPMNEFHYAIYADWLEDRGDPRSHFLRLFQKFNFHLKELSNDDFQDTCRMVRASMNATSAAWLYRLFGTSANYREMRQLIENLAS